MAKLISSLVGEHGRQHMEAAVNVRFGSKNETARVVGAAARGAGVPVMDGRWERVG